MTIETKTTEFEKARPQLLGVAYRLLGSYSEAEDAVQDTAYKWFASDAPLPDKPIAWLTAICTNRCLDVLKSAQKKRMEYVGPWLPEQLETTTDSTPEAQLEIASTLSTAFLLLLERLTPKERAAYLLHDIFNTPHSDIARMLNMSEASARQLAARGRKHVQKGNVRHIPPQERQESLLKGFQEALTTGDVSAFAKTLCDDVDLRADSGGMVIATRHVLRGKDRVVQFLNSVLVPAWSPLRLEEKMVNGQPGIMLWDGDVPHALVSFAYAAEGDIQNIFVLREPEKLRRLTAMRASASANGALQIH